MSALPVTYTSQNNAWVDSNIFFKWFHTFFVPVVREKLKEKDLQPKALLLLDNCAAHPEEDEMVSDVGLIVTKFLPLHVTSLIQPMDQGVLEAMK